MLNKVVLIGNLGADPEVRATPNGMVVTTVRLATTRRWKDRQTGERKEETEWHRVIFFNRLAETVRDYVKKGQQIYVEGRIQTRKWQAQDGTERYTTEIVTEELHMLSKKTDMSETQGHYHAPKGNLSSNQELDDDTENWLDEIPF